MSSDHAETDLPDESKLKELPPDGGEDYNRLVFEQSPYLRQHASNPVQWYPWGELALEKARSEDLPIFISIGYSTCRWCHVMARESFEDEEVANLLNQYFVPVKVDREERPDLDQIYMEACQAMTGQGGWPLNLALTPERRPFFAATYLPPEDRGRRSGLKTVLQQIHQLWQEERDRVEESAGKITETLNPRATTARRDLNEGILGKAADQLTQQHDEEHGGFGRSPKFPSPHNLLFLLRWWDRSGESNSLAVVEHTLNAMRQGGVYDHVGGGFHRYSTDRQWILPHFEKMLYDQAMHMMAYAEAYQVTGRDRYAETTREIARYLARDMTSPGGAFYAAEDAESEGEEGQFYVWTQEEWMNILGTEDGQLFGEIFNIQKEGNYREEATGERNGTNIPHRRNSWREEAQKRGMEPSQMRQRWRAARRQLLETRSNRTRPHRDEKVMTAWNGLMIAGLARAAQALDEEPMYQQAVNAADCVLDNLQTPDGRLLRYYRDTAGDVPGFADDYAFLALGLLELYEAGFEVDHLGQSLSLTRRMLDLFWDEQNGGLALVAEDASGPLVRPHDVQDGALPSSNSVALEVLLRLAAITGKGQLDDYARRLIQSRSERIMRGPSAFSAFLCGVNFAVGPNQEIVLAGEPDEAIVRRMCSMVKTRFLPRSVWLVRYSGETADPLTDLAPYTERMTPLNGQPAAYVCENKACKEPVTDANQLAECL